MSPSVIPCATLNDGSRMPMLGYGTGTAWYKSHDQDVLDEHLVAAVKDAIRLGYRHIDGAEVYGTEREIGIAIRESGVDRNELFVTTKVIAHIDDVKAALDASLEKLGLEYVDLYLIHAPFFANSDAELQRKWAEMEQLRDTGKAKSIGLSNFLQPQLRAVLQTARIVPAVDQVEFHPYLQHGDLASFCRKHEITLAAYAPLTPLTRAKGGPVDEHVTALARKHNVSSGEVLLRWCTDQNIIAITTSAKPSRLMEYLRIADFKLTRQEVEEIAELGRQKHFRAFWNDKYDVNDRS